MNLPQRKRSAQSSPRRIRSLFWILVGQVQAAVRCVRRVPTSATRVRGRCVPLHPHNAIRSNTFFEAVRAAGGVTAWADKHPAYDLVNGPSGKGVDDLYTPEITNAPGFDNTVSVVCTAQNDFLKVPGVINQIHGRRHDGTPGLGIPTVPGKESELAGVRALV